MTDSKWLQNLAKQLRDPKLSVPLTALAFTIVFYFVPYYSAQLFLIMASFLASDYVPLLLTSGGHGIFQFGSSTKTRPKGHAFLFFTFSIILTSIIIEILLTVAVEIMTSLFQNALVCFFVGLLLSVLAYLDMNERFYQR